MSQMEGLPLGCTPRYEKRYPSGKTLPQWQIYLPQILKQGNWIPQQVECSLLIIHMNVYPYIILGFTLVLYVLVLIICKKWWNSVCIHTEYIAWFFILVWLNSAHLIIQEWFQKYHIQKVTKKKLRREESCQ